MKTYKMSETERQRMIEAVAKQGRKLRNRAFNFALFFAFVLTVLNHFKG